MRVEIEIVVNRMIDAAAILAAETEVDRGHTEMIEKRRVVGTRSKGADSKVRAGASLGAIARVVRRGVGEPPGLQPLPNRNLGFRVLNIACHTVDKALECVRAFHLQKSAAIAIGIDVHRGFAPQLLGMRLGPFSGTEQPRLFAVPETIHDGSPWFPTL